MENIRYTYFLFGEAACKEYDEGGVDAVLSMRVNHGIDYGLFVWDEQNNQPQDILYPYNGWGDYYIITKEEYERLIK